MKRGADTWTPARVEYLKANWGKKSTSEIAFDLGLPSNNPVIGKAHRLGLRKLASAKPFLVTKDMILDVWPLVVAGANQTQVAEHIGVSRQTFWTALQRYGIAWPYPACYRKCPADPAAVL